MSLRSASRVALLVACLLPLAVTCAGGCGSGESTTSFDEDASSAPDAARDAAPDATPDTSQFGHPDTGSDAPMSTGDAASDGGGDAGSDAASDAEPSDAGSDGGSDAETDGGGSDAGTDAEVDAGSDAGADGGVGSGGDAGADSGSDAGDDSGTDAGGGDSGVDSGAACSPVAQTGCPAGEKCTINPPTCVPNGTVANGGACGPVDNCVSGELCTDDGTHSVCREFCASDTDCKQAAVPSGSTAETGNVAHCVVDITSTTWKVCTIACNPVTAAGASGCASGLGCTYGGETGIPELTDCETVGTAVEGATCTGTNDCASGLVCVNNGTTSHCRQVCRNLTNTDCAVSGDTCFQPSGVTSPMFGFCCSGTNGC